MKKTLLTTWLIIAMTGCAFPYEPAHEPVAEHAELEVTRQFTGTTLSPDPVMTQVLELAESGILSDVRMTRSLPAQIIATGPENVLACISSANSRWLVSQQECEYMSEESCTARGGQFHPCASACRHDPEAEACVLSCVPVCSFAQ